MKSTPLRINQGDDYRAMINVTKNGAPVDLTGVTAPAAQLRRDVADNDSTVDATFACTISLPSTIYMTLTHTQTTPLTGCYRWDLEANVPGAGITTIAGGPAHIRQEVTR